MNHHPVWLDADACRVEDLQAILDAGRGAARPAHAAELARGVPIYDGAALRPLLADPASARALMAEWHEVFADGAGVLVLSGAWDDLDRLDAVTAAFERLIEDERATSTGADHFAKAGSNSRVWNALQKLCLREPALFAHYYANPMLAAVSTAWLGPAYQMTSQINCVNPGGQAQDPHRDYHLGFCSAQQAVAWPARVHRLSPALTLQGAVAHVDMPLASGPTLLLPHSHKYEPGYLVAHRPAFDALFAREHVQLPLRKGDAVFFNPALIHAAGTNRTTDIRRMGNLLQVSSAFGRAMESVDRVAMSLALYPVLRAELAAGRLDLDAASCAIACCAEGYAFPTNLDLDPPLGGLAPQSHQALMRLALAEGWAPPRFAEALQGRATAQRA
ncbi:phytanoyl-CoA dioxygenase family protein [Leptothrix discophora]|uniref:Phytanoyl-CoA dioxygenase family protein n=1 Tax=Leptothrix discophora TaxID=89 RepID=A0ABT9FYM7_LEPDI|nr:phytanoyl-CoA dioxygenase family protein [Leptothrix discophora]MDP4299334.1 phytanoyl-CoA dioxygenase family protein [Leptothrix discophora]